MIQHALGELALAFDAEHDLELGLRSDLGRGRPGDVVEELVGLGGTGGDPQRLQRERRVAHPCVAVVPVPRTTRHLWERGRGCSHHRTGREVGQPVQHAAAEVDEIRPWAFVVLVQPRPRAPRLGGLGQAVADLWTRPDPGRFVGERGVLERELGRVSRSQGEARRRGGRLGVERDRRGQDQGHGLGACGHASVEREQRRRDGRVLGPRCVVDDHLDGPGDTDHPAHQGIHGPGPQLVTTFVAPHHQRVGERDRAARGREGRLEHHRSVEVASARLEARPVGRSDRPMSGGVVEDPPEDGGRVEPGEAQPVDRAAPAHQRATSAVRQQRVVGDRQSAHALDSLTALRRAGADRSRTGRRGPAASPRAARPAPRCRRARWRRRRARGSR